METLNLKEVYMKKALDEAQKAFEEDEVPIGAVIVCNNKIVGKGYNQTEKLRDVTAHAEMLAITAAAATINSKYLEECELYVTIEPCVMCMGAIKNSRISKVYIGGKEPKTGNSKFIDLAEFAPKIEIETGILETESVAIMQQFFQEKR